MIAERTNSQHIHEYTIINQQRQHNHYCIKRRLGWLGQLRSKRCWHEGISRVECQVTMVMLSTYMSMIGLVISPLVAKQVSPWLSSTNEWMTKVMQISYCKQCSAWINTNSWIISSQPVWWNEQTDMKRHCHFCDPCSLLVSCQVWMCLSLWLCGTGLEETNAKSKPTLQTLPPQKRVK